MSKTIPATSATRQTITKMINEKKLNDPAIIGEKGQEYRPRRNKLAVQFVSMIDRNLRATRRAGYAGVKAQNKHQQEFWHANDLYHGLNPISAEIEKTALVVYQLALLLPSPNQFCIAVKSQLTCSPDEALLKECWHKAHRAIDFPEWAQNCVALLYAEAVAFQEGSFAGFTPDELADRSD